MEPLPLVPESCSLDDSGRREQLERYRIVGDGAGLLERDGALLALRVHKRVPDRVIERLVAVERECCPFFQISWGSSDRRLEFSVQGAGYEPALDAIAYALGLSARSATLAGSPTKRASIIAGSPRLAGGES